MSSQIELSITGKGINPASIKAGDIANVLLSIQSAIEAYVFKQHPEIDQEQVVIGLTNIRPDSIDLEFSSPIPDIVTEAFQRVGGAVATNDFSLLPNASFVALDELASFNRKHKCNTDFVIRNGSRKIVATITPETRFQKPKRLNGITTVYGKVIRVGGRTPRVMIGLLNGKTLFCETKQDIAESLGSKLYKTVGLTGKAFWDSSLNIEDFTIQEVIPYEDKSFGEAIRILSESASSYYDDVADVDRFISEMRGCS